MPMQRDLYPEDWETIATRIKDEVNWECEDCGKAISGKAYTRTQSDGVRG
jgi:ribosomal protein L37AE/L43A